MSDDKPATSAAPTPSTRAAESTDWFDRWFGGFPRPRSFPDLWRWMGEEGDLMRVEEFTEGDVAVVRAEMPGLDPEKDVEITVTDHQLRIRAERRQETKTEDAQGYRSEFRYGSFTRTVPLPAGATDKDVKATYTDGVLEVRVPVNAETAAAKKIPVERG